MFEAGGSLATVRKLGVCRPSGDGVGRLIRQQCGGFACDVRKNRGFDHHQGRAGRARVVYGVENRFGKTNAGDVADVDTIACSRNVMGEGITSSGMTVAPGPAGA
jgi:hypothetical protein